MKEKQELRKRSFQFLKTYGISIHEKFKNICGKTGQYNIPNELFQKRTSRKNRVLMSWSNVKKFGFSIKQLESFKGGVVIEFLNNDYMDSSNIGNPVFEELKKRLGSDEIVSSIIAFRKEAGSSSSSIPKHAFYEFLRNTTVYYKGNQENINKENYEKYRLKQISKGTNGSGRGNDKWSGFLFVSIRGGQQEKIGTHINEELTLFNPSCEYASADVCLDIDLTLSYFALKSINYDELNSEKKTEYINLTNKILNLFKNIEYDIKGKKISLYDYCTKHPSVRLIEGKLTDPIQIKPISISAFKIKKNTSDSIDLTHNEAVNKGIYYWDALRKQIITPARPTNMFWSYHLSNMMQQDFNLFGYIEHEKEVYELRQKFKNIFDFVKDV